MSVFTEIVRQLAGVNGKLEAPSYVWEDGATSLTYIAYAKHKGIIETEPHFKIMVIEEDGNKTIIKEIPYNVALCNDPIIDEANIEATLTAYYAADLFKFV